MPRFAANISTMYSDLPFLERIGAAHKAGFDAVECQFPYEADATDIRHALNDAGVRMVLINTPPGDFAAGERGLAGLPGRQTDFREALDQAFHYAGILACPRIHIMAGIVLEEGRRAACMAIYRSNLRLAAEAADKAGRTALIEPINTRDIPGYLLNTPSEGAAIIARVDHPALRLQFDFYHAQIMTGDLCESYRRFADIVPHVQIANVPGRHEPDQGEIAYDFVFKMLDDSGFDGWVGCEYVPAGGTDAGLGWARAQGIVPRPTADDETTS